jgi:hypothetical protein
MQPARLRQQLRALIDRIGPLLEPAFERTPMVAGKVSVRRTRCGKPNCRCVQGELHEQQCLARWRGSVRGTYAVSEEQVKKLRRWTQDYRKLREARAGVRRWSQEVLAILGEIEGLRRVSEQELAQAIGGGSGRGKGQEGSA